MSKVHFKKLGFEYEAMQHTMFQYIQVKGRTFVFLTSDLKFFLDLD